jgi:hypothetical protein
VSELDAIEDEEGINEDEDESVEDAEGEVSVDFVESEDEEDEDVTVVAATSYIPTLSSSPRKKIPPTPRREDLRVEEAMLEAILEADEFADERLLATLDADHAMEDIEEAAD